MIVIAQAPHLPSVVLGAGMAIPLTALIMSIIHHWSSPHE